MFWDEFDNNLGKNRIRLLHHLTKHQSKIYNEAKKFKIKYNYRFLWCTNNKILLRKLPDSDVYHIQSFYDLARLQQELERAKSSFDEASTTLDISQQAISAI